MTEVQRVRKKVKGFEIIGCFEKGSDMIISGFFKIALVTAG